MLFISMLTIAASSPQVHAQPDNNSNKQTGQKQHSKEVKVTPGDTLSKLGKENKTSYQRIFYANEQIKDPDVIYTGQKLRIPDKNEKLKARPLGVATVSSIQHVLKPNGHKYKVVKPAGNYSKVSGGVWDKIAQCESGGNWSISTGNGYYGGLQFTASSWHAAGGKGLPSQASKSEQIARAKVLQSRQGWGAWPACTAKLHIR
jgi:hypothetical protein